MATKMRKDFFDLFSDIDLTSDDWWSNDYSADFRLSDADFSTFNPPGPYDPTDFGGFPIDITGGTPDFGNGYDFGGNQPQGPFETQVPDNGYNFGGNMPTGLFETGNPGYGAGNGSQEPTTPGGMRVPTPGSSGSPGNGSNGTRIPSVPIPGPGSGGSGGSGPGNSTSAGTSFSGLNPAFLPLIAALLQGYQGYKDSDEWKDFATDQRDILDPFGKQRPQYQQLLSDYYKDPSGVIENLPGFRAARDLAQRQLIAKSGAQLGGGRNGTLPTWVLDRTSELAALHADQYEKNLHNLAGAQFGPGDYGRVATTAMQESQGARNNALMAMAMALSGGGSLLSGGTSGSTGSGGDFWSWLTRQFGGGSTSGGTIPGGAVTGGGSPEDPYRNLPPGDPLGDPGPGGNAPPSSPYYPTPEDDNYVPPNPPYPDEDPGVDVQPQRISSGFTHRMRG